MSGGGDSVALLHLLRQAGHEVLAVTVDHGLRPESAVEAQLVAGRCRGWGISHHVLRWERSDIRGNLMDAARRARAGLIADWAAGQGLSAVALGHTADDQAETLLMGLSRAAGIDGLCGLRPEWRQGGVTWLRPMLRIGRAELRGWLAAQGLPWVEDPTNADDRYLRARTRKALAALAPLGLTAERLAESAAHLAQARAALDAAVAEAVPGVMTESAGALRVDAARFAALPAEIARRLAQAAVLWLSGADYPPRAADLARFVAAIAGGKAATLAGCRLKDGWLAAEPRAVDMRRWRVEGQGQVAPLGPEGPRQCPDWRATGLPRHVLEVTPGLWQGETLIAAPCAGFGAATAICVPSFAQALLSH
nr:tRNA lysidine(34) synthetase TilS [Rhodobacter sp. SGA-6-6]